MLKPIPARILKHNVTWQACTGVDRYQNPIYTDTAISRCVMQPSNETRKTKENTEVVLRGIMFADARRTQPTGFDFNSSKTMSETAGASVQVVFGSEVFTVQTVETLYDDEGFLHHYEIGLV